MAQQDDSFESAAILKNIRHVLMDMDGVLYRGSQALPGLQEFFAFLHEAQITFLCLTNNATQAPENFADKLVKMGVAVKPEEVINSSQATALYLKHQCPGGAGLYVVGMPALKEILFADNLFYPDDENPQFVVQGADFTLTYETVRKACLLIRAGAKFIATNADPVYPSEEGLIPGAGSIGALLQTATGQAPVVIGKPERPMYEMALEQLKAHASNTVMLGDNLLTDIEGANRLGIPTVMTLSGVTSSAEYAKSPIQATLAFAGLPELLTAWKQQL